MSFKITPKQKCFFFFLIHKIHFPFKDSEIIKSYYGLPECYFYKGIKIHTSEEMVILDMSGKGCRTCEELNPGWDWYGFMHGFDDCIVNPIKDTAYNLKGRFAVNIARLDLACDLLEDSRITLPFLWRYVRKNQFICKSHYHSIVEGNYEHGLYFGSPRSDRRLRVYDKALEQGLQGCKWVRFEFQLRNDNAVSFYLNLRKLNGNFAKCYFGMLHDYLRFTTISNLHDGCHSTTRLKICPWWRSFLNGVAKISQLYLPGNEYNVQTLTRFLSHECASSVETYLRLNHGDVTDLLKLCQTDNLNKKQRDLLKTQGITRTVYAADKQRQVLDDIKAQNHGRDILRAIGDLK